MIGPCKIEDLFRAASGAGHGERFQNHAAAPQHDIVHDSIRSDNYAIQTWWMINAKHCSVACSSINSTGMVDNSRCFFDNWESSTTARLIKPAMRLNAIFHQCLGDSTFLYRLTHDIRKRCVGHGPERADPEGKSFAAQLEKTPVIVLYKFNSESLLFPWGCHDSSSIERKSTDLKNKEIRTIPAGLTAFIYHISTMSDLPYLPTKQASTRLQHTAS